MADFVRAAATAKRLIEANGRLVTLYKLNRAPDDSAEPWRGTDDPPASGAGGETATALVAFVPPRGTGLSSNVVDIAAQLNVRLEQVGLLASDSLAAGVDINDYDTLLDGSDTWKIAVREELKPGAVSIMFSLGLKR